MAIRNHSSKSLIKLINTLMLKIVAESRDKTSKREFIYSRIQSFTTL
jgi:hypothetical protein